MSSKLKKKLFHIAGIGASAGGLEALEELFKNLPADLEMALVVVQHTDPTHETLLPEILAKRTALKVSLIKEGVHLEPGCVYICPSGSLLEFTDHTFHLVPRADAEEKNLPIDRFLRSLATHHKSCAIAVILSGGGSDGAFGLQDVKANGGITFAQDEQTAKFYSMPHSAILTGSVDFVLPPKQIANELVKISRHEYLSLTDRSATELPESTVQDLKEILKLVHRTSGVDFSQYKYPTISRRVLRRMALQNMDSLTAYRAFLDGKPAEVKELSQDLLIHVTKFFRDSDVFDLLKEKIFPALTKGRGREDQFRVWVPGCSSGEEIYSVLITLTEYLEENNLRFPIQAFGTDIGEASINKARLGSYLENIVLDVSPERLRRFFTKVGNNFEINKTLRDLCIFAKHNFLTDPPFGKIDLITCRNVLIYLEPALQKHVLSVFHYALKPTGILVLGNAESLGSASDSFTPLDSRCRVFSKKAAPNKMYFDFAGTQYAASRITMPTMSAPFGEEVARGLQFQREADRILLAEFIPPGVIIDDKLQVIQFRGQTGAYLEHTPGFASFSLLQMLRQGLVAEVKTAIELAKKSQQRVRKEDLQVQSNDKCKRVAIEVIPAHLPPSGDCFFLVIFEDMDAPDFKASQQRRLAKEAARSAAEQTEDVSVLRAELAATKEYLQSVNEEREATTEELKASNEEILSSNEELQSMNEELHTAKEELQSTNEELMTLNDELQSRNRDLTLLGDDLTNLFNSLNAAVILLNRDLKIRKFTPMAEKILRLIPADIGRSVTDLRPNIEIPDFEKTLLDVVATVTPKQFDAQDKSGKWYSVQMRPYRTSEDKINGVVLLFTDINELKSGLIYSQSLENTISHPLLILSGDLVVKRANKKFYDVFGTTAADTENRFLYQLGNGQWDIPQLRKLLGEVLTNDSHFRDFVVTHRFPQIGEKTMSLSGCRLFFQDKSTETIVLAIDLSNTPREK